MLGELTFLYFLIPLVYTKPMSTQTTLDEDMLLYWRRSGSSDCEPFTSYMVDCNKCLCSADAVTYCTRMNCAVRKRVSRQQEDSVHYNTSSERN